MATTIVDSALDERGNGIDDGDTLLMPLMEGELAFDDSGTTEGAITGDGMPSSTAASGDTAFLVTPLRVEAESLTRESGFRLENLGAASGGQVIKSPDDDVEARASYTFSGQTGIYDVSIGHFDEADGVSSLSLFVDGVEVDTFLLDQQLGSNNANSDTATVRMVGDVSIGTGDVVELVGFSDGGEPLRIDYIEFSFRGSGEPPSLIVDTAEDVVDAADGKTSLREVIALANATAGHDTVTFDPGVFDGEPEDILRLTQGEIAITDAVTIDGGTAGVTITGDAEGDDVVLSGGITDIDASLDAGTLDDNSRIFNVTNASAATTLDGLTLTGGRAFATTFPTGAEGGAVRSLADLTILGTTIDGNIVEGEGGRLFGAGVYGRAEITVVDSAIRNNVAYSDADGGYGGGVWAGGDLALTNSTVSGNFVDTYGAGGGGVYSLASITLTGSVVSGNRAGGFFETEGAGVFAAGGVTLTDSTVRDNRGYGELGGYGGGIYADNVLATASTISGNTIIGAEGSAEGGGIRANTVTLVNSTVANNLARNFYGGDGGGIFAGTVALSNSTVTGNIARPSDYSYGGNGGGIVAGTVELENSIVLGNFDQIGGAPSEIEGTVVQNGPNIIGGVDPAHVFADIDPATGGGLLADNGGPTETVAILATGAAAGGADPATATTTDQRGVARDADPDLGAFEAEQATPPPAEFRVEAETLARESGFKLESLSAASGGRVIKSPDPSVEAHASFVFTGQDGTYDLDLGYFDENDGASALSILVDGVEVDSFVFDQDLGSKNANSSTHTVRQVDDVAIETGDVIDLVGHSNGGEPLRIDYLEFTFVDDLIA